MLTQAAAERELRRMLRELRRAAAALSAAELRTFRRELQLLIQLLADELERDRALMAAVVLTSSQASRLLARLDEFFLAYSGLLTKSASDQLARVTRMVTHAYTITHQTLFRQAGLDASEVVTVFRVVPGRTLTRMFQLPGRIGIGSVDLLAQRHAAEASAAVRAYMASVLGRAPGEEAVRALVAMLSGELPISVGRSGLALAETTAARSLDSRAARLLTTETLAALRAATAVASAASPIILLGQWTLSDRHASLPSSPDVCDELAEQDVGYGAGWYPPELYPAAPHPYCGCYQGAVRTVNPSQWSTLR